MSLQLEEVRESALALPRDDRAALAHDLLDSLADDSEPIDPELRQVIESRLRDIEEGRVQTRDAYEVLAELDAKYASNRNASRG